MNHLSKFPRRRNVRAFVSAFISYLMLAGQLAPLALASSVPAPRAAQSAPATTMTVTAQPVPAPLFATGPIISATKEDAFPDPDSDGKAAPGATITYTVKIQNTGDTAATGVQFNDTVDPNTSLVPNSLTVSPLANDDAFTATGNIASSKAAPGVLVNDTDPDGGTLTVSKVQGSAANVGQPTATTATGRGGVTGFITLNADGSYTYEPPPGFTGGNDTFTYTVSDGSQTNDATVTITLSQIAWFIQNGGSGSNRGTFSNPFTSIASFNTANAGGGATDPKNGDLISLRRGTGTYAEADGINLRASQKLIGEATRFDAFITADASSVSAYQTFASSTQAAPIITTTAGNGVDLNTGNTVRGLNVGSVAGGAKIFGNGFGTLTIGNTTTPDVALSGGGQALNLTNGTFDATSAFSSVATTSSGTQGIFLSQVGGTVAFGSTTVSGSTTQGMLIQQSTANINFGNTSVTGGTDAISLSNNSSGTRTFGTISITTPSAVGFLHAVGGGLVVAGATTITNPTGTGIDIQNSTTLVSFGATTINKGATAGTGVNLANDSGGTTFASLAITTSNGTGLNAATSGGTITVSAAAGSSISATNNSAVTAATVTFNAAFTSLASTNSTGLGISLTSVGGTLTSATTNIQNPTGIGISVATSGAGSTTNFGNTTANASGGTGVSLTSNAGAITFADLDISPDSGQRALLATNNTGTITSTSGDIAATSNITLEITGASAAARTPLAMVLNNVDSTNSSSLGVNLNFVSGNLTVNDPGIATNISNPTSIGIQVQNTAAGGTMNFGNTNVGASGGTGVVIGTASNGNAGNISFADLDISPDSGQRALLATQNTGTITTTSGDLITTSNTAAEIVGTSTASKTPLNIQLTKVSTTGSAVAPNGIRLVNTSATGSPGGFRVLGTGGTCNAATPTCTGGRITNTTGADSGSAAPSGAGVSLDNAASVVLTSMQIDNHSNYGIRGSVVSGFTLSNSLLNGTNGTNQATPFNDSSIYFNDLSGTSSINTSEISGGFQRNVFVDNTVGTLDLTVTSCNIHNTSNAQGDDGLSIEVGSSGGTSNATLHITNNTFSAHGGNHFDLSLLESPTVSLAFTGNSGSPGSPVHPIGLGQNFNVLAGNFNGTFTYDISSNTINGTKQGDAITVNKGSGTGTFSGRINGNTIGISGQTLSGASQSNGISVQSRGGGTHTTLVTNNIIRQYRDIGINIEGAEAGTTTMNATVTGNTVDEPGSPGAAGLSLHGIQLNWGIDPGNTSLACVDIGGNTAALKNNIPNSGNEPAGGFDIRARQRQSTTVRLPGYTGANNDNAAVNAYLTARNTLTSVSATNTVPTGGGFVNTPGGAQCPQPTVPAGLVSPGIGVVQIVAPKTPVSATSQPDPSDEAPADATPTAASASAPASSDASPSLTNRLRELVPPTRNAPAETKPLDMRQMRRGTMLRHSEADSSAPLVGAEPLSQQRKGIRAPVSKSVPTKGNGTGGTVSVNIGTLAPGDSVTITFQVTIDDPFGGTLPQVSNQGTVSGGNFSSVLTDDPSVGGAADKTVTPVNATNIFARDGKVAEPASGNTPLLFTITLSAPAAASGISVNYATANDTGGAHPATGGAACDNAAVDYVSTSGTVNFAAGERVKTVSVTVCSDTASPESDETLLLNLSGAVGGAILDAQAVGTITQGSPAGTFIISELRTNGPGGAGNDFVELYNNTNTPLTVAASDASAGFGVFKMGTDCNTGPVLIATIPNGTVIPARGHFLVVGSQYSLSGYAAGDVTMTSDIETDHNVAVFSTADVSNVSTVSRHDAVGFDGNTGGGVCDLLREGNTLPPIAANPTLEHSFFRKECDFVGGVGCTTPGNPKDTNDNSVDFQFADTQGTPISGVPQHLGAPGPENKTSPIRRDTSGIGGALLDASKASSAPPNRVRDFTSNPGNNSTQGTLSIRRRFINNTGAPVTRLRFRIVEMTTFPSPGGDVADLRAITSALVSVSGVTDPATCLASTGSSTTPCTVSVQGTTLEQPPTQPNGGGYNSTMAAGTVTTGTPLANGASVNLQFLLGVQSSGSFRFLIIVEAIP